jgi:hypothetical protein
MRRLMPALGVCFLAFLVVNPAVGGSTRASGCGVQQYAYAGLESGSKANGISATLATTVAPAVTDGHVGGWVGVGGINSGPNGSSEWLQAGLAAFTSDDTSEMYYEVTLPGARPRYVELGSDITPGISHHFSVLEMNRRPSWWRVWVDGRPVSPPIHLPDSHDRWFPQAVAENWNGDVGACNTFSYRFSNVALAHAQGGVWRPLASSYVFQDAGYHVVPISTAPRTFLATSLAA